MPSSLGTAPHVLAPWLEIVLRQAAAHRLARYALVRGELDHLAGQQLQRPTGPAGRRARSGSRHQQGFLIAAELALRSAARLLAECCLPVAEHEAALCPVNGRLADSNAPRNLFIAGFASSGR